MRMTAASGVISLYEIAEYLLANGVDCNVYDSYADPTLPPYAICVETDHEAYTVHHLLNHVKPMGLMVVVRKPTPIEKFCICIGPPARDCKVHGDIRG